MRAIRVLVVDDHSAMRAGILSMLEAADGLEPAGAVASAAEAHDWWRAAADRPEVVLVDQELPDEDGLALALWLKTAAAPPAVVIYAASAGAQLSLPAVVAGADALVPKSADIGELADAVRAAAARERTIPPMPHELEEALANRLDPADLPILGMLRHGVTHTDIAATLALDAAELAVRRWGMLDAVTAAEEPAGEPRPVPAPPYAIRMLSPSSATMSPG